MMPAEHSMTASRRNFIGAVSGLAAFGVISAPSFTAWSAVPPLSGAVRGGVVRTPDGTEIFYRDWGNGPVVLLSHGWPLSSEAWQDQLFFLASRGFRVIAHDRRGHGRSAQPWLGNDMNTYAEDLAALMETLDLRDVTLVGHSTGGGEVACYIARHGTARLKKAVLVSAIPPLRLRTAANPDGAPLAASDEVRRAVLADRSQFYRDLSIPFFGANRPHARVSQGTRDDFWMDCMSAGLKGVYDCIKAQTETDFTLDLRLFNIPTMIIHGDDDQLVPIGNSARLQKELIAGSTLLVYAGAPHGLVVTHRERFNSDLLAFIASR